MTTISDRARDFIFEALDSRSLPSAIRSAIVTKLGMRGPKQMLFEDLIETVLDPRATTSARVAALSSIIDIAKGEDP